MNRLKLFIPLIIFIVLAGFFWRGLFLDPTVVPSALIDKTFPDFELPKLQDESQVTTKADLLGEVTLVNIWATWCIACKVEHPYLNELKNKGVRIVGVNLKDESPAAQQWLIDLGNPYQWNIVDKEGTLWVNMGATGAPETYLLDEQGVIRLRHTGVLDQRVWDNKFLPIIRTL